MNKEETLNNLYAYNTKQYFKLLFGNPRVLHSEQELQSRPPSEVVIFAVGPGNRSIVRSQYQNVVWLSDIGATLHPLEPYMSMLGIKDQKAVERLQSMYKGSTSSFYAELNTLFYTGKFQDIEIKSWELYREVCTNNNFFFIFDFTKKYGAEVLDRFMLAFVNNTRKIKLGTFTKSASLKVIIERVLTACPDFVDRFKFSVDSYLMYKRMGRQHMFWYSFMTTGLR